MENSINNKRCREPYYDNLRAILIYLVVLGHFAETAEASSLAPAVKLFIYSFHMPLFIFVSGLFFDVTDIKKGIQKCIGFLSLYVLMKCVSFIVNLVLFHSTYFSLFDTAGMPWFLFALAIWSLVTPIMYKFFDLRLALIITIVLALIVGYDENINSMFVLSRIIVFWPFFLSGTLLDRDKLLVFVKNKLVVVCGCIVLISISIIALFHYNVAEIVNPLLSGQNPYCKLQDLCLYGCLLRALIYVVEVLASIGFMAIVPKKELIITKIGQRTISIYFYDVVIYAITVYAFTALHMWQYTIISLMLVVLLSRDVLYNPINKVLNIYKK